MTFLERRGNAQPASPVTLDQARGFQRASNIVACRDGLVRIQGAGIALPAALVAVAQSPARAGDAANIVVQQAAPVVKVDPADPRVVVRQSEPTVTVRQGQPEIIVRQPAPTVTVNIPQPEITVRMPQPDVSVAMAQPQVSISQPPPQVQVTQPQQPQVQVQPSQPQVLVQRPADAQPNVQVQRAEGQPQIRYERAEPKVVVNQAQGQPQVHVEQGGQGQQANAGQPVGATANANQTRPIAVSQIKGKDVYAAQGQDIGEVERVVLGQGDQPYAVIKFGEVFGLGGQSRILPLSRMALRGDRFVVPAMSEAEFKALPAWRNNLPGYHAAEDTYQVPLALAAAGNAAPPASMSAEERRRLARERLGEDAAVAAKPGQTRAIRASELMNMDLYNMRGEKLGDIERVVVNPADNRQYVILGHGGFLGLFEDQAAIPLDRLSMRGDRLVACGLTEAELGGLSDWKQRMPNIRDVDNGANVTVALL